MLGWCRRWFVLLGVLGACQGMARAEVITIGAEDDWPPYSHRVAGHKEPQGLAPRLVRQVFATQGVTVQFRVLPFARCMREAEKGSVMGCFNATRTADNEAIYHWHATPLFEEELAIFGRRDPGDTKPLRQLVQNDLRGRTVGITVGYTYPTSFMEDSLIKRKPATSDASLLHMLAAGRVDYILINTLPALYRLKAEQTFQGRVQRVGRVRVDGFWVAFTRAKPDGERLALLFENGLQSMRSSGEHQRILADFRRQWDVAASSETRK